MRLWGNCLEVDRRRVLQALTVLCAGIPALALTARTPAVPDLSFTTEDVTFIAALAETLIPKTETPGAKEADIAAAFERLVADWASEKRRAAIIEAIASLRRDLDRRVGGSFAAAAPARRLKALEALDAAAYGARRMDYGEYRNIKALLVRLYYASEPGATLEAHYDPVPGGYDGEALFSELGRPWVHEPY